MSTSPADRLRPIRRTRQFRQFTTEAVDRADLDAIADVARWSGSSANTQPWRFIVVTNEAVIRRPASRKLRRVLPGCHIRDGPERALARGLTASTPTEELERFGVRESCAVR